MKIDRNGAFAVCKLDGKPFNYFNTKDQTFALGAFLCIKEHWKREQELKK